MTTIKVAGIVDPFAPSSELVGERLEGLFKIEQKQSVRIQSARAGGELITLEGVSDDDVLEVDLDGGLKLWTTVGQFQQDFGRSLGRGEEPGIFAVPQELPLGAPSRGVGTWAIKFLRVLGVDLSGKTALQIGRKLEAKIEPGLYQCGAGEDLELTRVQAHQVWPEQPFLLFLHGTLSSTAGSFGALWEPAQTAVLGGLRQRYGEHIYAFEHRTLTESPVENAVQLVEQLPPGARLHLVSHSRGGMIGELVCRSGLGEGRDPIDGLDIDQFADAGGLNRSRDRAALARLKELLREKKLNIERFVRVACPALGTTLASRRMDRWLSIVVNLVGQIPVFKKNPVYELVTDFLAAVLKERTDPTTLPGLEAMMPTSPLVRILNRNDVEVEADLSVIAGDIEASSLFGRLKLLLPDLYYDGEHDLVVNTLSMKGGMRRRRGARVFFDRGPQVNHFRYFENAKTAEKTLAGLTRAQGADAGFEPVAVERRPIARGVYRKPSVPQPVVFVLPGIMGSHLEVNGNRIWLDIFDLAAGGLGKLEIGDPGVQAQGLVASTYADLVEYLSACHEVVTFPYDWRRSIGEEAARFADEVAAKLDEAERHAQPVRILAHSMGGLVARAMIAERPDLWERIRRNPGGRLLMLGTPNGGSHVIPRLLVGQEQLFRYIALLDLRHDQEELLGIVARYPGILEMMPVDPALDLFDAGGWERIRRADGGKWALPKSEELARARELRRHLSESSIDTERMLYLAGRARSTPWRLLLGEGTRDHSVRFQATPQGDGRVPWSTGIPEGVRAWYVDAEHGELAAHEPSFPAIRELLETGDTQRLPTTPPAPERGVPASFDLPPDPVDLFPDQGALEAAALGFHRRSRPTVRPRLIRVSVTHGNLAYARHVVAVGHYQGDTIVSAEEDLDRMLGGGLRRAHLLGIYPGALGTSELFAQQRSGSRPAGVLVIGLGRVGELHPGDLTQTFTQALLRYVLEQMARRPEEGATEPHAERRPFTLSTLLIGSTAGSLSVQDAVTALLRAVCRANQALDARQVPAMVAEIELLELWEDRAIQAARALATLQAVPDLRQVFDWEALVRKARGAGSRIVRDEASGWWQRLQILGERDGSLRFNVMSGQARAETTLLPTQRALVDRFIERAIRSTHGDHEVGRTLFEILVPNRLKERVPDREDLILVLDEAAARYPWELLEDRSSPASGPLAVDKGLLRQLETPVFREQVSMTHQNTALVVGDPLSSFPELPGAQDETNAVWECLAKGGYRATKQIRANAETIVAALHADAYRIVHLAGHGVYEHHVAAVPQSCSACGQELPEQEERVSGMVIGDGVFLTAGDVEQMRRVPELVFVNCCHLGRIEDTGASGRRDLHRLAANLAAQFIRMGVRAVVAAGWAVDDGAAKTFAERFYGELLDGKVFGEAVRAARRETHDAHPSVNTWGAYQCYGDPDFALAPPSGARDEAGAPEPRFVAVSEAVLELESLANEAATAGPQRRAEIGRTLEKLKNGLPEAWRHDARLLAALGRLYGEFGHFREALEQYRAALRSEDAELALKTVEQMVNLQGRYAVALWRRLELKSESGPPPPNPADQIDEAIARLEQLLGLGQTVERLRLAASAYKRKALVTRGKSRREALEKMADYYRKVHEQALGVAEEVDPCPLLGALFAETILGWKKGAGDQAGQREWEQRLQTAEGAARIRNQRQPNFSDTVAAAEARLVRLLATEKFAARACARARKKIVTEYRRARDRAASPREFASVLDQLDFLLEMVESEAGAETRSRGLSELLHAICEDIARLG